MTTVNNHNVSPPLGKYEDPKEKGFFNRPMVGGKSLWDWLQLVGILLIPLVIFLATMRFNQQQADLAQQQHDNDQKIALDQQRADTLQKYLDSIQDLLLNGNLLKADPPDPNNPYNDVATLARARTLTALEGLDSKRKGTLVQFLYDAKLINGSTVECMQCEHLTPIISLRGADLRGADLRGVDLNGVDLSYADLSNADLSHTGLEGANFSGTNLSGTNLSGTSFDVADLGGANLEGAGNFTQKQLDVVQSCSNATLPPGLTCHRTP
jgi:uncharacterized protein YjbI with pentapeptide repeats